MEFGVFLNGYVPGPAAFDPACEHEMFMRETGYVIHADKYNWKYAWLGEHHSLTEYSHLSAPEVVMGYLAHATERIHVGTGIMNLSPRVNHPVRCAERVAVLDHMTEGRFEWGTGRGAGSHEIAAFNILDKNSTKAEWNEVIGQIPRMWEERDYTFEGEHFTVPTPHNILPKPYGSGHPPIWVGCGNPTTFTQAGELGIGAIAFNFEPIYNLQGRIDAYKEGIANCTEPLGQYVNDNIMMTNAVICMSDRNKAREIALRPGRGYLYSMVCNYHDTIPHMDGIPVWPEPPVSVPDEESLDALIEGGWILCGEPDEVAEQVAKYQTVGCDQLVFGLPSDSMAEDEIYEMLELFGSKVIPQFDSDPVHSTTRYRQNAVRKYPDFTFPIPDVSVEVLPTNAQIQLDGTHS
ncbi:MAG TPA: LLM class flavin-dependent oxidoreductase [Acidimicrobiales bacterium]|nr:LLM class flavin-dependent oxidoreductase [Acidimicrobiales bacterium]